MAIVETEMKPAKEDTQLPHKRRKQATSAGHEQNRNSLASHFSKSKVNQRGLKPAKTVGDSDNHHWIRQHQTKRISGREEGHLKELPRKHGIGKSYHEQKHHRLGKPLAPKPPWHHSSTSDSGLQSDSSQNPAHGDVGVGSSAPSMDSLSVHVMAEDNQDSSSARVEFSGLGLVLLPPIADSVSVPAEAEEDLKVVQFDDAGASQCSADVGGASHTTLEVPDGAH
ncbi:hypothetical protein Nepgr_032260 [Nepenthes gracilis]|uniref:Uncharacterized protein n=1 Tax=Nepenthes gracilis TaxID=150966 RepID=A0AAD3Y5I4_NEPGR|nr:hypothetical protein Nepgr_032260 [Nepenthes gracilis]